MDWSTIFDDIEPLPQQDGPVSIAPIAYSDDYRTAMDYFRALAVKNELSKRALELCSFILEINSAHYTIWHYRLLILKHLNDCKLWETELKFLDEFIEDNRKNYQVWRHRQLVVEQLGLNEGSQELKFSRHILSFDEKNYHAWTYRQWVIRRFDCWQMELEYIDYLLDRDIRNNSAWNQRYYVKFNNPHSPVTRQTITEEIKFAFENISQAPSNECSWNYLEGIIDGYKFSEFPEIEEFTRALIKENPADEGRTLFAYGLLLEIVEEKKQSRTGESAEICETLKRIDPIRRKYWAHRQLALVNGN